MALIGALNNRKTKKIKTEKSKHFICCSIFAIAIIFVSIIFIVVQVISSLILNIQYAIEHKFTSNNEMVNYIVGSCLSVFIICFFTLMLFISQKININFKKK
jgi:uncharacterized membrane protein YidH (DUF202 family)